MQGVGFPQSESNMLLSRAQFVPNTPRNGGHSRFVKDTLFLVRKQKRLARASAIQSSKLVIRVRFSSPAPPEGPSQRAFLSCRHAPPPGQYGSGHNVGH
jgi:hypothetical protein